MMSDLGRGNVFRARLQVASFVVILFSLSDGQQRCQRDMFLCGDGKCISKEYVCDGSLECVDGSDETTDLCTHRPCSQSRAHANDPSEFLIGLAFGGTNFFRCNYGACITEQFLCDGVLNCFDGTDESEEHCGGQSCASGEFQCNYGACVSSRFRCNGKVNCRDGSDETPALCDVRPRGNRGKCRRRYFKCDYGACVYQRKKCNGKADCADGSDESEELCGTKPRTSMELPKNSVFFKGGENDQTKTTTSTRSPILPTTLKTTTTTTSEPKRDGVLGLENSGLNKDLFKIISAISLIQDIRDGHEDVVVPPSLLNPSITEFLAQIPGLGSISTGAKDVSTTTKTSVSPLVPVLIFEEASTTTEAPRACPRGRCQCPPPLDHVCLECLSDFVDVSSQCKELERPDLCSRFIDDGVDAVVLQCGNQDQIPSLCGTVFGVPLSTTMLINCWGLSPMVRECRSDSKWHPLQNDAVDSEEGADDLCQPNYLNSEVCGVLPPVVLGGQVRGEFVRDSMNPTYAFPWIVGISRRGEFSCTGVLVSRDWILTAAHCITESQDFSAKMVSIADIEIEHQVFTGDVGLSAVSELHPHPNYKGGPQPENDLALLKFNQTTYFSTFSLPICLDTQGDFIGKKALTFNRTEGDNFFHWDLFSQTLDLTCFNRERRCSRHVDIGTRQFCAKNKDPTLHLYPGSSGGPYLINTGSDSEEKWAVAGVLSSLVSTSDCPYHTILTSISMNLDWIRQCVRGICTLTG